MTTASERVRAAVMGAALAASWPSVVAAALLKFELRFSLQPGQTMRSTFIVATSASAAVAAAVGWFAWPSARRAPGLWGLYGVLGAFLCSSMWAVLGEITVGVNQLSKIATSSVVVWFYGGPVVVVVGVLIGCEMMFVMKRRPDGAALGVSYGLAVALAMILKL